MPLDEAHRQALPHRSVLVIIYDKDERIYVQRRCRSKAIYPGRWDLSATGHVKAGESRLGAALRELEEELRVRASNLTLLAEVAACPETNWEFVTLYAASGVVGAPSPNPDEVMDGMYLDRDELEAMVENFREMLTPALVAAWEGGYIYPLEG
ncbi:NUDIX hydrolase [Desulfovibrio ferrophilus]|uniref:NUDIX hydrolase n=2 Tax=Desulfovibrio ferrophilus TaxID=241368 RepID=A0A2Z6AWL7_9BACT|nr:NUDIX hydrolase [Desulfovibrio ferrophilus]